MDARGTGNATYSRRDPGYDRFILRRANYDPRYCYIALPAARPTKFEKIRWDVYSVPLKVQALLGVLAYERRTLDLALVDSDNKIVLNNYVPLPNDVFDDTYLYATLCYDFYDLESDNSASVSIDLNAVERVNALSADKSIVSSSQIDRLEKIQDSLKSKNSFFFLPTLFIRPDIYAYDELIR